MRIVLELDDELVETLLARLSGRSKTEAIEVANTEDVSQELRSADRHRSGR